MNMEIALDPVVWQQLRRGHWNYRIDWLVSRQPKLTNKLLSDPIYRSNVPLIQAIMACTTSTATKLGTIKATIRTRAMENMIPMEIVTTRTALAMDLATIREIAATATRNTTPMIRRWPASSTPTITPTTAATRACMITMGITIANRTLTMGTTSTASWADMVGALIWLIPDGGLSRFRRQNSWSIWWSLD